MNSTPLYKVTKDVIFYLSSSGLLVAYNVYAKSHVELNSDAVEVLRFLSNPQSRQKIDEFIETRKLDPQGRDLTVFSNEKGLLADPTNVLIDPNEVEKKHFSESRDQFFDLLSKRMIIISDERAYLDFFQPKSNLFDNRHFGNFHQQLGHQLRLVRREDPELWWTRQKYKDGADTLQDNLYKFIQFEFYEKHFTPQRLRGKRVLDVGCGTGFYSRFLAKQGAQVLGIDPTDKYVALAQAADAEGLNVQFQKMDIASGTALEALESESFDFVFFQDALLFYFVPYGNEKLTTRKKVLTELKRSMKKDGIFIVTEPHGVFWLQPWLGDESHPFTILTEYAHKTYGVTPTLEQMSEAFEEAGLCISRIYEPKVSEEAKRVDPKGYAISREFPQWWLFELIKREKL